MYEIMIVDDDLAVANYLMVFLTQSEIYHPTVVSDPHQVLEMMRVQPFDAVILDVNMPGLSGFDLLKEFRRQEVRTPVVVLSGVNDVELAVRSLKLGAFDYLAKPVEDDLLLEVLRKAITSRTLQSSIERLPSGLGRGDLDHEELFARLKTRNPKMIRIFHQVERMAAGSLNIFIRGELGTGRKTLARVIHEASPRWDHPFVAVNAASHDPKQFAALLFGVARGWQGVIEGRTGYMEQAHLGSLFIANNHRFQQGPDPGQLRQHLFPPAALPSADQRDRPAAAAAAARRHSPAGRALSRPRGPRGRPGGDPPRSQTG